MSTRANDSAEAHYNRGFLLQSQGHAVEAAASYRAAVTRNPQFVEAHINLGNVLQDLGQNEEALSNFRRALALRPDVVGIYLNIGATLQAQGRFEEAALSYQSALANGVSNAQLHNNLGNALRDAGRLEEAVASFRAGLEMDPQCADLHLGLGSALQAQGRLDEAVGSLRTAAALDPESGEVHGSLGAVLLAYGRIDEAIGSFRRALACNPELAATHSGLLLTLLYSDRVASEDVWREHRRFADRFEAPLVQSIPIPRNSRDLEKRLKVGYVSADFRAHSVAYFIEPILERHDRSRLAIYCYSTVVREDAVTSRLRAKADHWRCCAFDSDEQLARRVAADGIDVLVDLSGHTAGNRLLAFARRPAPIQLSWIGYPFATGLRQIDLRLTDPHASPQSVARAHDSQTESAAEMAAESAADSAGITEALYRLPRIFSCYRPPSRAPDVAERPGRTPGLGPAVVTLGSFNNSAKLSDRVIHVWSRLLRTRRSLRLILKDKSFVDARVREWMVGRFAAQGIERERLDLVERMSSDAEHLNLYGEVDIALDTFPYCGVTTTCEALWMGIPVVSLAGDSFVSRMGATLLTAVGHPEWVATDTDGYIERVLALADDEPQRQALRRDLRSQMRASSLMDEIGFTRELEDAYRAIWRRWCARTQHLTDAPAPAVPAPTR